MADPAIPIEALYLYCLRVVCFGAMSPHARAVRDAVVGIAESREGVERQEHHLGGDVYDPDVLQAD